MTMLFFKYSRTGTGNGVSALGCLYAVETGISRVLRGHETPQLIINCRKDKALQYVRLLAKSNGDKIRHASVHTLQHFIASIYPTIKINARIGNDRLLY